MELITAGYAMNWPVSSWEFSRKPVHASTIWPSCMAGRMISCAAGCFVKGWAAKLESCNQFLRMYWDGDITGKTNSEMIGIKNAWSNGDLLFVIFNNQNIGRQRIGEDMMIMESWGCILLPKGLDSTHHYSLNTYFLEVNEGLLGSAVSGITGYINDKYTHIYI